jgi:hypothetical protein
LIPPGVVIAGEIAGELILVRDAPPAVDIALEIVVIHDVFQADPAAVRDEVPDTA